MTDRKPHTCELCQRTGLALTRHHLIPRKRHRRRSCQQRFDRDDMRTRIAMLCKPCHATVHATLSEKELEETFNTLDALASHPDIARFVHWVRHRPIDRHIVVKKPRA